MKQCLLNFNVHHKSARIEHYIFIAASKCVIMSMWVFKIHCCHGALFCHLEQKWTTLVAMVKQIDYTNEETIICFINVYTYTLGIFEIIPPVKCYHLAELHYNLAFINQTLNCIFCPSPGTNGVENVAAGTIWNFIFSITVYNSFSHPISNLFCLLILT